MAERGGEVEGEREREREAAAAAAAAMVEEFFGLLISKEQKGACYMRQQEKWL